MCIRPPTASVSLSRFKAVPARDGGHGVHQDEAGADKGHPEGSRRDVPWSAAPTPWTLFARLSPQVNQEQPARHSNRSKARLPPGLSHVTVRARAWASCILLMFTATEHHEVDGSSTRVLAPRTPRRAVCCPTQLMWHLNLCTFVVPGLDRLYSVEFLRNEQAVGADAAPRPFAKQG